MNLWKPCSSLNELTETKANTQAPVGARPLKRKRIRAMTAARQACIGPVTGRAIVTYLLPLVLLSRDVFLGHRPADDH